MSASKTLPSTPYEAVVLVCDGRKALVFQNDGSAAAPRLRLLEQHEAPRNPPTHDQGADRPGRTDSGQGRKSAVSQTDFHDEAERAFAIETSGRLDRSVRTLRAKSLVIVAPPRTLAILRDHMTAGLTAVLVGEVAADLTRHTVPDIENHLAMAGAR